MSKLIGTVKFFKNDKGFGFVAPDDGTADVFVHISDLQEAGYDGLSKGDKVEFERVESRGRIKAKAIKIIS